jgi:hypothetical protein
LVLVSCFLEPREDIFVIDTRRCGEPMIGNGCLSYEKRRGRMFFSGPQPDVMKRENGIQLSFRNPGRTVLYAFSNESFELLEFSPNGDRIRFRDDTGSYLLDYEVRVFGDDDMAPIGGKGLGKLFLSQKVKMNVEIVPQESV